MLSGVTHETRALCSKLCSVGGIMFELCRTKMTLPPHTPPPPTPIGSYLLTNIPSLPILKEMLDNIIQLNISWASANNANPRTIYKLGSLAKCTGYESKVSSSKNIPTFINFVHSRAKPNVWCSKNIIIMPALCLMLQIWYYAQIMPA